eukprot:2425302-Prymnesium_polylepis.1
MLRIDSVLRYCVTERVYTRYCVTAWLRHRVARYSREKLRYSCVTAFKIGECPLAPHADMKSSAHLTSSF